MLDYFEEFLPFFAQILNSILDFIFDNDIVFDFFFLGIASTCVIIIVDFIFNIRNDAAEFNRLKDEGYIRYKFRSNKKKKQNQLDMNEVYRKSKENADYKHSLKMKEMEAFRKNEDNRHAHRHEEHAWYLDNRNKKTSAAPSPSKKVNLDIEVED